MTAHQYEADGVFQGGGVKGIALAERSRSSNVRGTRGGSRSQGRAPYGRALDRG